MTTTPTAARLRALVIEANALLEEIEAEEKPLPRDTFAEGTVLVFTKLGRYFSPDTTFDGRLKYAAIKAGGNWYLTGSEVTGKPWHALLDFIGEENYPTIKTISQSYMHRPDWAKPEADDGSYISNVRPRVSWLYPPSIPPWVADDAGPWSE